jgi:hypothetical protein
MAVHYADAMAPHVTLVGVCNRCGECCKGPNWRCSNLVDEPDGTTTCSVYEIRTNGMPIQILLADGNSAASVCWKDSTEENRIILPHIGGPCSLTVVPGDPNGH